MTLTCSKENMAVRRYGIGQVIRQPQLQALMMDESTLLHHQVRMVDEDQLYTQLPDHPTEPEQQLFHRLTKRYYGKTRLEQERLAPGLNTL